MKTKNLGLIIFSILLFSVFFSACGTVGGNPNGPDVPKDKNVSVQYIRVGTIDGNVGNIVNLRWGYAGYSGVAAMGPRVDDENNFSCGAQIKTETKISIGSEDWRKYTECGYYARKRLFIDGYELTFEGSGCGSVEFIYHNDGKIEITKI
jgi:hypothetical protein